jgi:hypothetical protein
VGGTIFPINAYVTWHATGSADLADSAKKSETNVKTGLLAAYRRFMAPLVRILIRNGISFNEFADELRGVYVDVAASDFPIEGRSPSGTRVAILTGLTRKEVKRQLERGTKNARESSDVNRVNRVLDGWHQDPEFTGPYGVPLELKFDGQGSGTPDFMELVRRYSGDMSARAMLDELHRIRAVEVLPEGEIRALTKNYISSEMDDAILEHLGNSICHLAETLDHNFETNKPGQNLFERTVFTTQGISEESLREFQQLLRDKGQIFVGTLDNFLTAHENTDTEAEDGSFVKTGVGIYHFIDRERDE